MQLESWKDSFKNWSQWINATGAAIGGLYILLPAEVKADLPVSVVSILAGLYVLNIFVRNWKQPNKE
jgi:hypothetical protein